MGQTSTRVAKSNVQHTTRLATSAKIRHFAKVCHRKQVRQPTPQPVTQPHLSTQAVHATPPKEKQSPRIHTSNIRDAHIVDPAPTVSVHISSLNGAADMEILPDSGADISVAGKTALSHLSKHKNNLLPSTIIPRAVNRTRMQPIGKLPVKMRNTYNYFHIYWGTPIMESCYRTQHLTQVLSTPH